MYIPDRRAALAFRILSALVAFWGIARITGLFSGHVSGVQFLYFTVLSNILCLGWFVALAVATGRDLARSGARGWSTPSARFGGAVMMAITVTMLIYLILLVPETFTQGNGYTPFTLTDDLIHIITPVLTILDWLLFTPKGRFRWFDPPLWAIIPLAYLAFAFVYGALGGTFGGGSPYPYPFMEVDRLGVGGVAVWIVALAVALEAVAFVYVAIDRLLGRVGRPAPVTV
ncbi:Pr6Pr family membrane protein [Microbacterium sp. GXF7504]